MQKWDVYLHGKWIDSVFFSDKMSGVYVKTSLVDHDGFSRHILVVKGK